MSFFANPIPELIYAVFSLCDNALSTALMVWLCWQFPTFGRRPGRALLLGCLLLFGTPAIVSLGQFVSYWDRYSFWLARLYAWNLLWTATAFPFFIITMVFISRVTGIVVAKDDLKPPSRQAISIRDLCVWTLVVAIVFALFGTVSRWMQDAVASFGAQFSGAVAVVCLACQAVAFAATIYLLLPNLKMSIGLRVLIGYAIYVTSRGSYVVLMASAGQSSVIPPDFWAITAFRGISAMIGMILGHRILMSRGYQYWQRPKKTSVTRHS